MRGEPQRLRLRDEFLTMRGPAQKREVGRHLQFGVTRHVLFFLIRTARAGTRRVPPRRGHKAPRETPSSRRPSRPRCGSSRACGSSLRPISRHHSGAMRSGPCARATRRSTRRQVKRAGGPSGISAMTRMGSGQASRNDGRGAFAATSVPCARGEALSAGRALSARSGIWLACATTRMTRSAPKRLARRSTRRAGSPAAASSRGPNAACSASRRSTCKAARTSASTPKPASRALSFSCKSAIRC